MQRSIKKLPIQISEVLHKPPTLDEEIGTLGFTVLFSDGSIDNKIIEYQNGDYPIALAKVNKLAAALRDMLR